LKLPEVPGDDRLRHLKVLGGSAHAAEFDHQAEDLELAK
jgi:hypothetical protein